MGTHQAGELLLAETANSAGTTSERALTLLQVLRQVVPYDGAFLAFADPLGHGYQSLMTIDLEPEDEPPALTALALLSPAADLHGLTPRELEVLGLVVEGCSNQQIARTLVVAPRTVATHLEHVLFKLGTPTRTLAAVRAERDGLYVPAPPAAGRAHRCGRMS